MIASGAWRTRFLRLLGSPVSRSKIDDFGYSGIQMSMVLPIRLRNRVDTKVCSYQLDMKMVTTATNVIA